MRTSLRLRAVRPIAPRRRIASRVPPLTTYLLHAEGQPFDVLARFIERAQAIESPEAPRPKPGHYSDSLEEPAP